MDTSVNGSDTLASSHPLLFGQDCAQFIEALVGLSPLGIYLTDAVGSCIYVNRRWCEMAGMELKEALGRGWERSVHPDDRPEIVQRWYETANTVEEWTREYRMRTPRGATTWVLGMATAIYDGAGRIRGHLGINVDISDRKEAEERLRLVLEAAPDGIIQIDREGRIHFANAQAERVFGFARGELLHQPIEMLVPERLRMRHTASRTAYTAAPTVRLMNARSELLGRRRDGSEFTAEIALSPMESDEGLMIVATVRDITDRKRSEQLALEREAELVAAQRIQEHILPRAVPDLPGWDIAGALVAAEYTAGDYYDYLPMPDGSLGVVVGDVSGHGFSAALIMASVSAHLRSFVSEHSNIGEILQHVNTLLHREIEEDRFVTLVFLQIVPSDRTLRYVNLGHPPGYILGRSDDVRGVLRSESPPLAVLADIGVIEELQFVLQPDDIVLLTTDGILEARSPRGVAFGMERVLELVRSHRDRRASEIVLSLQQAVREFTGRNKPEDDLTAVVIKVDARPLSAATAM